MMTRFPLSIPLGSVMVRIENSFLGIVAALLLFRHFPLISSSASGCGRNIRPAACCVSSTLPLARIVLYLNNHFQIRYYSDPSKNNPF